MIAWWGWLLIWAGLVLALLGMLAGFAWWLFRKSLVLLDDLGELGATTALLQPGEPEPVRPPLAVLAAPERVRAREDARRAHRDRVRREARARRLDRARRITRADASTRVWPEAWYPAGRDRRRVD